MVKTVIAGNWKMNHGVAETEAFCKALTSELAPGQNVEAVICPPMISLHALQKTAPSWLVAGVQNVFYEPHGAYTGEISPQMVAEVGVQYGIVGHSERRTLFGETDEDVALKVEAMLHHNMTPILCVGENERERNEGDTFSVVKKQVKAGISKVAIKDLAKLVFAYEPIWAIGTGKAATPEDAEEVCAHIRELIHSTAGDHDQGVGDQVPILYGGSVNPDNLGQFLQKSNINGALVGGKSLKADSYIQLIRVAERNA